MVWRRLFNLAAVVSLLLCVAAVALWVRSYWTYDTLTYVRPLKPRGAEDCTYTTFRASSLPGRVECRLWLVDLSPQDATEFAARDAVVAAGGFGFGSMRQHPGSPYWYAPPPDAPPWEPLFSYTVERRDGGKDRTHRVSLPHWLLACAGLPLPLAGGAAALRRRKRETGE